ncbi:MAG: ABC transporter substrate-binding protein, partial [Acidimicrobiales bacterium]
MSKRPQQPLRLACAALGLFALLTAACGSTSTATPPRPVPGSFPVTIAASNGTVHIAARPHAIVSLSPTATEMLYAIGAGSQVKAVDKDSDYPKGVPRTNLDGFQPNVEAIAAYKPDLVVEAGDTGDLTQHLGALGIPVLSLPAANTLEDTYNQLAQLGLATGHVSQAAKEVATMKTQIASVIRSVPKAHGQVTYYYELDPTYYSVTSSTFIGNTLSLLGLTNIADSASGAAASGGYPQLSSEFIVQADPDFVFLADTLCCGQDAATVATRPGWSTMKA